jgi:hypothetical protein
VLQRPFFNPFLVRWHYYHTLLHDPATKYGNNVSVPKKGWKMAAAAPGKNIKPAPRTFQVENTFHWNVLGAGLIFLPGAAAAIFQPFFGTLTL